MNRKPQILIIADFPNWAYYFIQQFIVKNLSEEFEIDIRLTLIYYVKKTGKTVTLGTPVVVFRTRKK